MVLNYSLSEVAPYINWLYFYHAWGMSGKPEGEREHLRAEAEERLRYYEHSYQTHAVFQLFEAYSEGDDIVLEYGVKIPCLRQQEVESDYLCLSDFVQSGHFGVKNGQNDTIGVFGTTVDANLETDFEADPYAKLMMQLLADRLAEATAERMHEEVRRQYWGYAKDEQLTLEEILKEISFEGKTFYGPSNPDKYLSSIYGDYMKLPPKEQQHTHIIYADLY